MRLAIPFALVSLLAACGSDGPGSGPITAADAEDGCRQSCEHEKTCHPDGTQTVEDCTTDCVGEVTGWVRADAFEAIIDCTSALACDASGDACVEECAPTSTHQDYETQCREVFATCGSPDEVDSICETTPTGDGDRGFFCLIATPIIDEMIDCIPDGTACQAGIACLQGVLEAHHIDF